MSDARAAWKALELDRDYWKDRAYELERRLSIVHEGPDGFLERAVLGAMLVFGVARNVIFYLADEDFSGVRRMLFVTIRTMLEEDAAAVIDIVTVSKRSEALPQAPSFKVIFSELVECSLATTTAANAEHHAKQLAHATRFRRLQEAAADAARTQARSVNELAGFLEAAIRAADAPGEEEPQSIGEILARRYNTLDDEASGRIEVIRTYTGIERIDGHGAMRPGELWLIGARPSCGKTALAWQIAEHAAKSSPSDGIVLFFSIEMHEDELAERDFSRAADLSATDIRAGRIPPDAWGPMHRRVTEAEGLPLYVIRSKRLTVERMTSIVHRASLRGRVMLVVIDYAQLMRTTSKHDSREQELSFISKEVKATADIAPVLMLAQLNKEVVKRTDHRPQLTDFRECDALGHDADVGAFLHREFLYDESADPTETELIIRKNRHGGVGTIRLKFLVERSKFVEA